MIESAIRQWRGLAGRERRMLVIGASVLLLAFVYLVLVEPAWQGRRKLAQEIPTLRAQLAQLSALSQEARRLSALPPVAGSIEALRRSVDESVKGAGMASNLTEFQVGNGLFEMRFKEVPHALWLEWLDTTLRETRLRVAAATITRETAPGIVSVRLVLEAPAREGR